MRGWLLSLGLLLAASLASPRALAQSGEPLDSKPWLLTDPAVADSIQADFERLDPRYVRDRAQRAARLEPLKRKIIHLQEQGHPMTCSQQILVEAAWVLKRTVDWPHFDRLLEKLDESLPNTNQDFAAEQSPQDGAWGLCYESWFLRLDATVDALNGLAAVGGAPHYPLFFLSRIATPDRLIAYLDSLRVSDIVKHGMDQRDELAAAEAAISQLLFKPELRALVNARPGGLIVTDRYVDAYRAFLDRWQDPKSGYWAAAYRSDGRTYSRLDLSMTFHTVSYRRGDVLRWPQLIDTLLATKDLPYPTGWIHDGHYNHHNNYDVATILRYGWPHMAEAQRVRARAAIGGMLEWCLTGPAAAQTPFAVDPSFYDSVSSYYYYGVSFLSVIGYWNHAKRFWTKRQFPEGPALCRRLRTRLLDLQVQDTATVATLRILERSCPQDPT